MDYYIFYVYSKHVMIDINVLMSYTYYVIHIKYNI